ncbi:sigma-70 family RNA polymerase sigma factor [Bradyrhizobium sp.]|uniref:sigma-70 family RNA polymerase sigma factor n=1 Tax=Bradyrhizobium sp. TaxID=376 RepID=UPI002D6A5E0B|nr:sigma-70 family RNA polymerase sigma factor [Bradyrhizobium sp.]HZR74097.1 sigma-70 family RNA polymerase sigma factor [Bradyrhizobium sp.]
MTTTLSVHRTGFRCTEPKSDMLKDRLEGSVHLPSQQQISVAVVQNKDERSAFDEVFLPYLPEAYRLAQWLAGNASDADDIVQEAAIRAFRGIKSFGAVNARAWSLTIVRNTALTWLTKNRPKTVTYIEDLNAAEQQGIEYEGLHGAKIETPEEAALLKADAEEIQKALAQLPTQFREVIVLREINQMNYRDIAEVTNVPIGTVMSRLSRGRQLLMTLLGEQK